MITKEQKIVTAVVTVPSASIKAIVATDYELVPAPGAGKVLVPLYAIATMRAGSTPYTWANTDHSLTIGGMVSDSDAEAQAVIEAAANTRVSTVFRPAAGTTPPTENQAIKLEAAGTGEPAAGNGDLVIRVMYTEIDVTDAE